MLFGIVTGEQIGKDFCPDGAKKGTYRIRRREALNNILSTLRTPDYGDKINLNSLSDGDFVNHVLIYLNGQLLLPDSMHSRRNNIINDVARQTGSSSKLVFAEHLLIEGDVVQVVVC